MASPVLHIKDSYYFDVPKALWRSQRQSREDFPAFWVRLDPDYQLWQAQNLHDVLSQMPETDQVPSWNQLRAQYTQWKDQDHANFGKPLLKYLQQAPSSEWFRKRIENADWREQHSQWLGKWNVALREADSVQTYFDESAKWSTEKIDGYNEALHGKILISYQPFGKLNNLYEADSGFCISRFMVIELLVAILISVVFIWLGGKMRTGGRPLGRLWNFLEAILLFLRDQVARPAIGKHDADRFVPLLWTVFLFVLGCNLMGMLPWAGAPTGAFGMTFGLAVVTFATVLISGTIKFGPIGFWTNQVPTMDLPIVLAIVIKPMIFAIEVVGLGIKHAVLSIRLLANMVAGHVVLLGIMTLAFSLEGALSPSWTITAVIAIVGSTLFSCLELFVACLQAYIFTFLSALFIGAAIHHH